MGFGENEVEWRAESSLLFKGQIYGLEVQTRVRSHNVELIVRTWCETETIGSKILRELIASYTTLPEE